ncbi:hypothetical protein [Rhizobium sp. BR 315]|uniref:hypothetical protein n=1 Tax=Rhizobium sp. BR 315 TaxID=3040014 RepID=UPI000B8A5D40
MAETRRSDDLALAWSEAWGRGDAWREALAKGLEMMLKKFAAVVHGALLGGFGRIKETPKKFGFY